MILVPTQITIFLIFSYYSISLLCREARSTQKPVVTTFAHLWRATLSAAPNLTPAPNAAAATHQSFRAVTGIFIWCGCISGRSASRAVGARISFGAEDNKQWRSLRRAGLVHRPLTNLNWKQGEIIMPRMMPFLVADTRGDDLAGRGRAGRCAVRGRAGRWPCLPRTRGGWVTLATDAGDG